MSQIEDSLLQRQNLLANIVGQVQNLIEKTDQMNDELVTLRNENVNLWLVVRNLNRRIAYLEANNGNRGEDEQVAHDELIVAFKRKTSE